MPLLFHNGIWIEDAFTGGAFTIPAKNSRSLGWSNFDITFFYGGDKLSNPFVGDGRDHGQIGGVNMFVDAYHGYVEAGYAYIQGADNGGRDYNSVALSFDVKPDARVTAARLTITGRATHDGTELTATAVVPGNRFLPDEPGVLLAVGLPTPFKIIDQYVMRSQPAATATQELAA